MSTTKLLEVRHSPPPSRPRTPMPRLGSNLVDVYSSLLLSFKAADKEKAKPKLAAVPDLSPKPQDKRKAKKPQAFVHRGPDTSNPGFLDGLNDVAPPSSLTSKLIESPLSFNESKESTSSNADKSCTPPSSPELPTATTEATEAITIASSSEITVQISPSGSRVSQSTVVTAINTRKAVIEEPRKKYYTFDQAEVDRRFAKVVIRDWSSISCAPNCLGVKYMSSKTDKSIILEKKLAQHFKLDAVLRKAVGSQAELPIHIFVDLSNIIIGFYDRIKLNRGVPVTQKCKAPPFSFPFFAFIMERGRRSKKRIVAGSAIDAWKRQWPKYMVEADETGYEMNILERVTKTTTTAPYGKQRYSRGFENGFTTSPMDSADDYTQPVVEVKLGEQGVDELLHLKMLQSVFDEKPPSTLVLATGDAAAAEYSDGFLKHVERALSAGWIVELVAWKKGLSSAWRNAGFNEKWGNRFRIIELDPFAEELFASWYGEEQRF